MKYPFATQDTIRYPDDELTTRERLAEWAFWALFVLLAPLWIAVVLYFKWTTPASALVSDTRTAAPKASSRKSNRKSPNSRHSGR